MWIREYEVDGKKIIITQKELDDMHLQPTMSRFYQQRIHPTTHIRGLIKYTIWLIYIDIRKKIEGKRYYGDYKLWSNIKYIWRCYKDYKFLMKHSIDYKCERCK